MASTHNPFSSGAPEKISKVSSLFTSSPHVGEFTAFGSVKLSVKAQLGNRRSTPKKPFGRPRENLDMNRTIVLGLFRYGGKGGIRTIECGALLPCRALF
jgi:hypothetical protein